MSGGTGGRKRRNGEDVHCPGTQAMATNVAKMAIAASSDARNEKPPTLLNCGRLDPGWRIRVYVAPDATRPTSRIENCTASRILSRKTVVCPRLFTVI